VPAPSPLAVAPAYHRHRPEQIALYAIIAEHYPRFVHKIERAGGHLPQFVRREFEDYLKCGLLEHGFMRHIHMPHPTGDPWSCKSAVLPICPARQVRRLPPRAPGGVQLQTPGFTPGILPFTLRASLRLFKIAPGDFVCPSCGARRMVESAAHVVDHVFPEQPVRQRRLSRHGGLRACSQEALSACRPRVGVDFSVSASYPQIE
jgi:hypothetical protein